MPVIFKRKQATPPPEDQPVPQAIILRRRLSREGRQIRRRTVAESLPKVNAMIQRGLINPEATGKMGDPETLDQFIRLYNIGAPEEVILKVLNLNKVKYNFLLGQYQSFCMDGLVRLGPMGVLSEAYTTVQELSRQAKAMLSQITTTDAPGRKDALDMMRFIREAETEKVRMIVTTGAVAQKKKVDLHPQFGAPTVASKVVSPGRLMELIGHVIEQTRTSQQDTEDVDDLNDLNSVGLG